LAAAQRRNLILSELKEFERKMNAIERIAAMFLVSMLRALRAWLRYRNRVNALSQLDDHLLRDIGLSRGDLKQMAFGRKARTAHE
jgi:uncharacterized protein YjiS (DUF1127 family)